MTHHTTKGIRNRGTIPGTSDELVAEDPENLLLRFPNVILHARGHSHSNRVWSHRNKNRGTGYWEISTASIVDHPHEGRTVEMVANGDGTLSLFSSPFRPAVAADPSEVRWVDDATAETKLGAKRRINEDWLAAAGIKAASLNPAAYRYGAPEDRVVELPMPDPHVQLFVVNSAGLPVHIPIVGSVALGVLGLAVRATRRVGRRLPPLPPTPITSKPQRRVAAGASRSRRRAAPRRLGPRRRRWRSGSGAGVADVRSRAVLITGCSTGIGRATAEHLAAKGWPVYATARRPGSIADLQAKGCSTLALDVTDEDSMQAAVESVEREHGAVGVLVNNAGYGLEGAAEVTPMDEIRRQFETNVFGLFRMCQLVLPGMRRQGHGRIVNLSSVGGKLTFPGGAYYHATKHAVEAYSDALRFETRGFGVHVVVVEPGLIKTAFGATSSGGVTQRDAGPYAEFNEAVAKLVANAYEGMMARVGGAVGPEAVAEVIERAIVTRTPKTRYRITSGARFMLTLRKILPDRMFDAFLRTQYPRPSPE